MQGSILDVDVTLVGDALDADHTAGDTTVQLVDVSDFLPSPTGSVVIDGTVYDYTSVDSTTLIMTLTTGLVSDALAGERVNINPLVIEKWAKVELNADDDVVLALVPHALWDRIPEGVRNPEGQEPVVIEQQAGDWVVLDVLGSAPVVSGVYIDPATAPVNTELGTALDDLAAQVNAHDAQIIESQTSIENVTETATDAGSLASIANVSTTLSDYEPAPGEASGKREGSLWLTRTRARINYVTNPSFEVNVAGWTAYQTVMLRELSATVISGSYSMKLTNSGVSDYHLVDGARQAAAPGQTFTGSVFAAAVSAASIAYVQLVWYAADNTTVLLYSSGTHTTLLVDDYQRLYVTAVAPASAAFVGLRVVEDPGAEGSVWRLDGALLELDDILGRYFDGRSYDGAWSGTADASTSSLAGGKLAKAFELENGAWAPRFFSGTALRDVDASVITSGTMDGERIADYSLPQDKLSGTPVIASETLVAGDLVNVWNSSGLFRIQKANASNGRTAHGFVLAAVTSGAVGILYSHGYNPFVTGLTPGVQFLSTVAGKAASTPPTAVGTLVQRVGVAGGATVLNFISSRPINIT